MDIAKLLKGIDCSCGKFHSCDIEYVSVRNGAIAELRDLCREFEEILLVADGNTFAAAGDKTLTALEGKKITKVIFSGDELLIPDEKAIDAVTEKLGNCKVIVGIGSGVIQDLCKYVSFKNKIPYMVVATAPSMDGYASTGAAMILGGMKVTVPAGVPKAILADTQVLKNAPMDMIKAGYGDIVGKFSALNDWKLSHAVNDEYLCEYIYDLTMEMTKKTLGLADGLLKRDEKAVEVLMEALVVVGIAMSFAGSSRPASGSEHHLSHFFEITGILNNEDYFTHGIDVAYSTVVTARIREKLLKAPLPQKQYCEKNDEYLSNINRVYGKVAEGCIELQKKVGNYEKDRLSVYKQKENEIREILSEMPTAAEIEEMLERVEISMNDFYNMYSNEKIEDAVRYSKDLKDRWTVLWMNYDFGE